LTLDIARQRLNNQRLIGAPFESPEAVVRLLGAVQAQDYPAAKWGIGQRVKQSVESDVDRAFDAGAFLRTHVMRPTWHFVVPEDIRWLQELTSPRVKKAMSYYDRGLGIDEDAFQRSNDILRKALSEGQHLTRPEAGKALEAGGITASGQRLAHLLMRAELDAIACSGAMRGKQHTYALVEERAPNARTLSREEALAELTRRYFEGHGPALPQDFAWWSGLTVSDARAGIESVKSHLLSEAVDGKTYWFAPNTGRQARIPAPIVHLLPNYDEYFIAYRDHSASYEGPPPSGSAAIYEVLSRHIVALDGMIIGGWRTLPERENVIAETRLFANLDDAQTSALTEAASNYSRFIGKPVIVRPSPERIS
jgi:hypothetical protein